MEGLLAILIIPWIVGWFYGRHLLDPSSHEGRRYYLKGNTDE